MASNRLARKLFYIRNCLPVKVFSAKSTENAARGACAHLHQAKMQTMASAAQDLAHEEAGSLRDFMRPRGHFSRGGRYSPHRVLDVFDSFFPNRRLRSMMSRMDRLFDDPFFAHYGLKDSAGSSLSTSRSPWDVVESADAFRLRLDLPGLSKEEMKVYVEDGYLVIKGEHNEENKADEAEWSSQAHGSYSTRILLPDNVNAEQIKAELKNGVLSVTVPKLPEDSNKTVIDVSIQ